MNLTINYRCIVLLLFIGTLYKNKTFDRQKSLHIFINDAFYYNESKVFPDDTIVILFSGFKFIEKLPFFCYSLDKNLNSITSKPQWYRALEAPPHCKLTVYVVVCPVIENIEKLYLTSEQKNLEQISFQASDKTPRNLVICMSRMFSFENWQLFITAIEIYKHFGANLIVTYLISLHPKLYKIMQYYETEGFLKIKPGHRYFQPEQLDFDPNTEGEWNNQDASYNSCLYEFKESAEFMLFADWDDILIPAYHDNYKQEVQWLQHLFPKASSFIFPRFTVQLLSNGSPFAFDLSKLLKSLTLNGNSETGKHISMPSKIEGTWIHAPTRVNKSFQVINLGKNKATKMLHFRRWRFSEIEKNETFNQTFFFRNISGIKHSFDLFVQRNNLKGVLLEMPKDLVYYPMLVKCYDKISKELDAHSYHRCPSTPKCNFDKSFDSIQCLNLASTFRSVLLHKNFHVHQRTFFIFKEENNGCLM